jgi:catecholate siderophore receptor
MRLWPKVENPIDATDDSTPANTPEDTLTLWASWDVTHEWEIGGGAYYISQRYVADTATNVDQVSVSGYTRWDATLAYHKANYEIRLNVLNLTDKFYYDALIQSDGGRSVPGIGRTALLTATYRFM